MIVADGFMSKIKRVLGGFEKMAQGVELKPSDAVNADNGDVSVEADSKASGSAFSGSLGRVLLGPIGVLDDYYFPVELTGGCCPRVVGSEQDIVWNAAAEATDSERVNVVWQAKGDKIWYLAVRSAELGTHPNTWCPFSALLPGLKDAETPPTCYTYYSDEAATMMTVTADGLQIHRGTSAVVRAKAERTSRELDNAPIIELAPERIDKLTPMPWYSVSLFEERARRILAAVSVVGALAVIAVSLFVWFVAAMTMVSAHTDTKEISKRADQETTQLMGKIQNLRGSSVREQLSKFADLNDGLLVLNGWLEMYQIKDGKTLWRAIVPVNVTANRISDLGAQTLDNDPQGVVVGNAREALTIGER